MRRAARCIALALSLALALASPSRSHAGVPVRVSTLVHNLQTARGLVFDSSGRLYVTLRTPGRIYRCTPPDTTMSLWSLGYLDPIEMVFDDAGFMYVVDFGSAVGNGFIWKVTSAGVRSSFAVIPNPSAIVRDADGNFYVGEYYNQKIDKITPAGVVSTYVPVIGAAGARLSMLNLDTDGTLYAGMLNPGVIYKIGPGGSPVTVFNSSMASCVGFVRGADGNWYASSYDNQEIWQISPAGVAQLVAGVHGVTGRTDESSPPCDGTLARFNWPAGMTTHDGAIYIAEWANADVRMFMVGCDDPTLHSTWGRLKAIYH
jgi:streptogramin lyase